MEAVINFIIGFGVIAILFVVYAESGLLIGFLFPGDSLLFTAGFLVQQGILDINVFLFATLLFVASSLGQSTGYIFGKKVGRKLFEKENSRFFKKENLIRTEEFYKKHGPFAIVLACYVPIIRTFVPIVAGISKMSYKQFIPYNLIGAFTWTWSFTLLGYFAGGQLKKWGINVEVAAIIIILLSISPMIVHFIKSKGGLKNAVKLTLSQVRAIVTKK